MESGSYASIDISHENWIEDDIQFLFEPGMAPILIKMSFFDNDNEKLYEYLIIPSADTGTGHFYNPTTGEEASGGSPISEFGNYISDAECNTYVKIYIYTKIISQLEIIDPGECSGKLQIEVYTGPGLQNTQYI